MSAPTAPYRPKINVPSAWRVFCSAWLRLDRTDAEHWWQALSRSAWSHATETRSAVLAMSALSETLMNLHHWLTGPLAPTALIHGLECLHQEGQLSREQASRLEWAILAVTAHDGQWKESRE